MACFRSRNVVQSWEPRRGFVEIDQCVADRVLKLVHQWFLAFMPHLSLIHLHMLILSSTIIKEVLSAWGGGCFATAEVEEEAWSQINGAQQRQCHSGNKGERKTAQLNHAISSPCKRLWIHFSLSLHPHCRRKVLASCFSFFSTPNICTWCYPPRGRSSLAMTMYTQQRKTLRILRRRKGLYCVMGRQPFRKAKCPLHFSEMPRVLHCATPSGWDITLYTDRFNRFKP